MILINLLPPEMRKKQGDVSPLVYGIAACYLVALIPVGTWAWLKYSRLPFANEQAAIAQTTLDEKTAEAAQVEALEGQIAEFEAHRNEIVGLLAHKIYWARAIDDFVNYLNGPDGNPWLTRGFEVSCSELTVSPMGGGTDTSGSSKKNSGSEVVLAQVRGKYKLVGLERDKAGDYIKDFFLITEASKFWSQTGFIGKPDASYRGDTPDLKLGIKRVTVEFSLDWVRAKKIASATAKPAQPGM